MKIFGIVAEYNPLHAGHVKHLNYTKSLAGKDGLVVCIMSGNFTQRGEPAVMDKFTRAKHAILLGADAVIELPILFATGNATDFAFGGVSVLNAIKADSISCGSECGDANSLRVLSQQLLNPSSDYLTSLKSNLSSGLSYASATAKASSEILNCDLLNYPNNLLAVEYLSAMAKTSSSMNFYTIKRQNDYNNSDIISSQSASAIRKCFYDGKLTHAQNALPSLVYNDLKISPTNLLQKYRDFIPLYLTTQTKEALENIDGVSEGLQNRIINCLKGDFESFVQELKTKRYTRARLNRVFLNAILNITKETASKKIDSIFPLNLLAIKQDEGIIKEMMNRIESANNKACENEINSLQKSIFTQIDNKASMFYNTICNIVTNKNFQNRLKKY